jgi:choline monooxygenase
VSEPGDYFATKAGTIPVVLVRDKDGELKGFVNVCRHRGHVVMQGSGHRETLQCPYHAWTYGLDGCLLKAPRSEREPGFDGDNYSLFPVQVDTWGPFIFVNVDLEADSLAETLGVLPETVAETGIDLDSLKFHHRGEYVIEANWKIAVENYLECYHCAVAHPGFSQVVDVSPGAYKLETHALGSSQFGPSRNGSGPVEGQFHWLWPATKVYALPGPPNLAAGAVAPLGPERTRGFLDYFFPEEVTDAEVAELLAFDDQVGLEDRALVESVQAGVRSGLLDEGRLLPESEKLLVHFQSLVREALA